MNVLLTVTLCICDLRFQGDFVLFFLSIAFFYLLILFVFEEHLYIISSLQCFKSTYYNKSHAFYLIQVRKQTEIRIEENDLNECQEIIR